MTAQTQTPQKSLLTRLIAAGTHQRVLAFACLLYTSDAADERSSVDLGGRRIIKKKNNEKQAVHTIRNRNMIQKPAL